jgi:glycosyltransferase involved in cell wall biosynthesis
VDPARTKLIYNGIDLAPFLHTSFAQENRSALVFIIVANLIQYKGHADLIEAFASISHTLPRGWELWCVGRDDGLKRDLQRLAKSRDVSEQIKFLGPQTNVPSLLKSADISVLSSHEEGFSNAILEAMAAGLPVVATDVGGNAEAVVDGETGLIVPPRDPIALGQALLKLAVTPQMRAEMGRRGKERVERYFSLKQCAQAYSDLYTDFLKRTPDSRP